MEAEIKLEEIRLQNKAISIVYEASNLFKAYGLKPITTLTRKEGEIILRCVASDKTPDNRIYLIAINYNQTKKEIGISAGYKDELTPEHLKVFPLQEHRKARSYLTDLIRIVRMLRWR